MVLSVAKLHHGYYAGVIVATTYALGSSLTGDDDEYGLEANQSSGTAPPYGPSHENGGAVATTELVP